MRTFGTAIWLLTALLVVLRLLGIVPDWRIVAAPLLLVIAAIGLSFALANVARLGVMALEALARRIGR